MGYLDGYQPQEFLEGRARHRRRRSRRRRASGMQPAASSDASDAKSSSKGGETTRREAYVGSRARAHRRHRRDAGLRRGGRRRRVWRAQRHRSRRRNGAKTVVIERNTTFSVRGVDVGHIGSKHHKSNGFDLDPRVAARFLHQASHQTTNYDLIYVWASRSGEVFDYIEDLGSKNGVSMVPALSGTAKYGNWSTLSDRWRVYPDAVSFVRGGETYDMRDDGQPVNVTLGELVYNSAVDNGAEFVFEARAEQLVGDAASGITGVVATTKDGKHVQYNAKKGVILATGDIGGNQEMVDAFCPISNRSGLQLLRAGRVQQRRRPAHGHVGRRGHVEERSRPDDPPVHAGHARVQPDLVHHELACRERQRRALRRRDALRAHADERPHEHPGQRGLVHLRLGLRDLHHAAAARALRSLHRRAGRRHGEVAGQRQADQGRHAG